MRKKFCSLLAVVFVVTSFFMVSILPAFAETIELTQDQQQNVFDAWFEFLYTDFQFSPMRERYTTLEDYKNAEKDQILFSDTVIDCYYNFNNIIAVQEQHKELSFIDVEWTGRIGRYNFDFSGVNRALYIYKDHKLYHLKAAYEKGLVDDRCLSELSNATGCSLLYRVGDVDRDAEISVSDIIQLRKNIMKGFQNYDVFSDIDGSGDCLVSDVIALRKLIMDN